MGARIGCLLRFLFGTGRVRQDREPAPGDRPRRHTLDCPPDCSCWQELRAADDAISRATADLRFALVFDEQLQATAKEIETATERGIGLMKIYVGPALFDEDMPPAFIRLDAEARADVNNGEPLAWLAVLQICETHRIALKNKIAGE